VLTACGLLCCARLRCAGSSLISILLTERGWKEWPSEDWFLSKAGEMLRRPKDARQVAFCNCASYSTVVVDAPGSDHAYDRLLLADICGHTVKDTHPEAFICPPTYKIKNGGLVGAETIDETWNGERPSMWFLKENSRNYGQGIDVCSTAEEALEIAARNEAEKPGGGREYVLQPHIVNPLLYLDTYKFHIRVYALIMLTPSNRYPRNFAHVSGKMPISTKPWSPDTNDKTVQITTARGEFKYEAWEHYRTVHPKLLDTTAVLLDQLESKIGPQAWAGRAAFELLGLDFMLDRDFTPYLLEANTGPVLKVEDDMELITGITNLIFGTAEEPLEGQACGTGPVGNGWVELNDQRTTPERRMVQVRKLVDWMTLRTKHPECSLCLDEELVKHCTDELVAFMHEKDTDGLSAVVEAGAVEACLSVLDDEELEPVAQVYAATVLAELFDYDEVILKYVSVELIQQLMPHMDCTSFELQALSTSIVTNLVDVLDEPLPSDVAGVVMGTILWQLDSSNFLVAEAAAACLTTLCSDPVDGVSCSTTALRLGAVPRLRLLAGLDAETGISLPVEQLPFGPDRVSDVALDALEAIALAQQVMAEVGQTLRVDAGGSVGAGEDSAAKLPDTGPVTRTDVSQEAGAGQDRDN
jgi:hypothetical protein